MRNSRFVLIIARVFLLFFLSCIFTVSQLCAYELKTSKATIIYDSPEDLEEFNYNIYMSRGLGNQLKSRRAVTMEDEVIAKVDILVDKVGSVLDMYPKNLKFTLRLFADTRGVQDLYMKNYGRKVNYIAFYSISRKTMYVAVNKVNLRVFAHETGHVVVDHYFKVRPPYKIHEVMAQYAEKHISD